MGSVLRIVIIVAIGLAIILAVRRIWRDWTGHFRMEDRARHQRDIQERQRPDVIELHRDGDGVYRPDRDSNSK